MVVGERNPHKGICEKWTAAQRVKPFGQSGKKWGSFIHIESAWAGAGKKETRGGSGVKAPQRALKNQKYAAGISGVQARTKKNLVYPKQEEKRTGSRGMGRGRNWTSEKI